jgi:hypothetical protein
MHSYVHKHIHTYIHTYIQLAGLESDFESMRAEIAEKDVEVLQVLNSTTDCIEEVSVAVCTCMYMCLHVCMCMCVCVCVYIYIYASAASVKCNDRLYRRGIF